MTGDNRKKEAVRCPVCKKETAWKDNPFRPFCSERCRMIDLGRWAAEEYRIAGEKKITEIEEGDEKI
ncbi:MAG: DNA gyrase inhibitor YacG [Nitrospirota bacterium]